MGDEEEDWFDQVARHAERDRAVQDTAKYLEVQRKMFDSLKVEKERLEEIRVHSGAYDRAAREFGMMPSSVSSSKPTPKVERVYVQPSPEAALEIILESVRKSDDPFTKSGEWITLITNQLSAIARESMEMD